MTIQLTLTNLGRQLIGEKQVAGDKWTLDHVQLGSANGAVTGAETAIQTPLNPNIQLPLLDEKIVIDEQNRHNVTWGFTDIDRTRSYDYSEVGLFSTEGIAADPTTPVMVFYAIAGAGNLGSKAREALVTWDVVQILTQEQFETINVAVLAARAATETQVGIARIATSLEAFGDDDRTFITPKKLGEVLANTALNKLTYLDNPDMNGLTDPGIYRYATLRRGPTDPGIGIVEVAPVGNTGDLLQFVFGVNSFWVRARTNNVWGEYRQIDSASITSVFADGTSVLGDGSSANRIRINFAPSSTSTSSTQAMTAQQIQQAINSSANFAGLAIATPTTADYVTGVDVNDSNSRKRFSIGGILGLIASASTTVKGLIEIATNRESVAGTDTVKAVPPAGVEAHFNAKWVEVADKAAYDALQNKDNTVIYYWEE